MDVSSSGMLVFMTDVIQILSQFEQVDLTAAEQLLPLVFDKLRKLPARRMEIDRTYLIT